MMNEPPSLADNAESRRRVETTTPGAFFPALRRPRGLLLRHTGATHPYRQIRKAAFLADLK
jgi:hypothetical protein